MRKSLALFAALAGCLVIATGAWATLPCAANSSCAIEIDNTFSGGCADADLVWCPGGDADFIVIRATVRNCLDDPLAGCNLRLDLDGQGDPQDEMGATNIAICGSQSQTQASDANGAAAWVITGGGCGRFDLDWTITAECATPEVELCDNTDQFCVKSADFTGDLTVNFFDTFKYLPALNSGLGYCADFNCDGAINFFDTFKYLPHLNGACSCTGWTLTAATLGECP
ncbi:MAG: hypothetical protein JW958_09650 [Candidatus Eisenbacteria bacterium]|nr:hypothetical protein [Candidatus Eisenbacteria bacterium]